MAETEARIRKFLVYVDDTPECRLALRFACRRAKHTGGGVTLLRVVVPGDFQHWMAVEDRMREEALEEAEQLLHNLAGEVNESSGIMPELVVREGIEAAERGQPIMVSGRIYRWLDPLAQSVWIRPFLKAFAPGR